MYGAAINQNQTLCHFILDCRERTARYDHSARNCPRYFGREANASAGPRAAVTGSYHIFFIHITLSDSCIHNNLCLLNNLTFFLIINFFFLRLG